MTRVIVDTGPLVAYVNRRDRWHQWVRQQMRSLAPPLVTCEPVITEACFLIHRAGGKPSDLIGKVVQHWIEIGLKLDEDAAGIEALMTRHADTPMSLADACLVRLTERLSDCRLFTLHADFAHYRRNGRQLIPLLCPK
jgi:predicted nucleic acid-binding protein